MPERRFTEQASACVALEERADGPPKIVGYASVFYDGRAGTQFELWKGMVERITPGAFDEAMKRPDDVRGLFNHDTNQLLGRRSAETLTLSVDKVGLRYDILVGDTTVARDVLKHVKRGDLTGSSFSFRVTDERFFEEGDHEVREILSVKLFDVGPVTFPAYEAATTGTRATDGTDEARKAYEAWKAEQGRAGRLAGYRARAVEVSYGL